MPSKRLLLSIHRWCGLAACLLIFSQALTGSTLLFREELAGVLSPGMERRTAQGAAPLGAVLATLQSRFPDFEIQRVVWPQDRRDVYFAHMVSAGGEVRYASVDPGNAAILREGGLWRFPLEALLAVHLRLLSGKGGLAVVVMIALSLLTMAASGAAYWWPKPGRVRKSLRVDFRMPAKALLRQLHRTTGLAIAAVALFSVVTGALVALEYLIEPGPITSVNAYPGGPRSLAGADQALANARALYPDRGIRDVRMPRPGVLNICFWAPQRSALAVDIVKTRLPEGAVTSVAPASADHSVWITFLPLHTGEAFGLPARLLLLVGGLGLLALAVTGPIMWLQRRS